MENASNLEKKTLINLKYLHGGGASWFANKNLTNVNRIQNRNIHFKSNKLRLIDSLVNHLGVDRFTILYKLISPG